ncbi:MAG: 5'-3' exonuclease [Mycobacteriales bacterium]
MADRLLLLDTPSLYFRAYYGVPEAVKAPDGTPVNAVRGLIDMVAWLISERKPQRLVAAMDADWRPQFRVDLLPSYKAHRVLNTAIGQVEEIPDTLAPQVPIMEEVLRAVGIPVVGVEGYEADDVIGTMAVAYDGPCEIVTGDRDLFQLVRGEQVRVLYTQQGLRNLLVVDEKVIESKYGIPGRAYADFALLRGDPSDGLPGVPGVGDKTAAALITAFGSVDKLLVACEEPGTGPILTAALRRRIEGARDYIAKARVVVDVAHDVPLPEMDTALPRTPKDPDRLVELAERWGLDSSLNRLLTVLEARS